MPQAVTAMMTASVETTIQIDQGGQGQERRRRPCAALVAEPAQRDEHGEDGGRAEQRRDDAAGARPAQPMRSSRT
jgi:hypothetical protein